IGLAHGSGRAYNRSGGAAAGSRCIVAPTPTNLHCTATIAMMKRELPSMSADTPSLSPPTAADLLARVVAARDLDNQGFTPPGWLWQGYLGPGKVTLLTSQWKSGKTTLVSLLLARLQQGGQLLGLPVAAGKAFVISE